MTQLTRVKQVLGVQFMLQQEKKASMRGGILAGESCSIGLMPGDVEVADAMGLGKTLSSIATIVGNPSTDKKAKTTLVVAPLALLQQYVSLVHIVVDSTDYQMEIGDRDEDHDRDERSDLLGPETTKQCDGSEGVRCGIDNLWDIGFGERQKGKRDCLLFMGGRCTDLTDKGEEEAAESTRRQ